MLEVLLQLDLEGSMALMNGRQDHANKFICNSSFSRDYLHETTASGARYTG